MLTRIVSFLIALLVAWVVGLYLTDIFWFLPIKEIAEQINFRALLSKDASFYVGLLIWGFLLWKILEAGGLAFLIAGPQRYGNTKLVRKTQGMLLKVVLLALFSLPVIAVFAFCDFGKNAILRGLQSDRGVEAFLAPATADLQAKLGEIEQNLSTNAARQGALKIDATVEKIKDLFRESKGSPPVEGEMKNLAQTDAGLRQEQQAIQAKITTLTKAYDNNDPEALAFAREAMWDDILRSRPWRLALLAIRYLWLYALPFGALLYLFFGARFKLLLARLHAPLLRFYDLGNLGYGGSSRFAGMFEEMELELNNFRRKL